MSQAKVTSFYRTRKRRTDDIDLKSLKDTKSVKDLSELLKLNKVVKVNKLSDDGAKLTEKEALKTPKRNLPSSVEETDSESKRRKITEVKISLEAKSDRIRKKSARKKLDMGQKDISQFFNPSQDATETKNKESTVQIEKSVNFDKTEMIQKDKRLLELKEKFVNSVQLKELQKVNKLTELKEKCTNSDKSEELQKGRLSELTEKCANSNKLEELQKGKLSELKEKLTNSGKMEEIQSKMEMFDKAFLKLKTFQSNKCKVTTIIAPSTKESSSFAVSTKEEEKVPAYAKFHALAAPGYPNLTLPFKYRVLAETFRCSDTVVGMLNNRKERCTFEKLQNGVQDMLKRNFNKTHLGQIKTVFPKAYEFVVEKSSNVEKTLGSQHQLVIVPNLNQFSGLPAPKPTKLRRDTKNSNKEIFHQMTPAILVDRRNMFHTSILNIAKKYHQEFLLRLKPPVVIPPNKLTKWHPKFAVDSVPEVVPSDLPELPGQHQIVTAKDALEKMRGTKHERIEKALQLVAEKYSSTKETEKPKEIQKGKHIDVIKGISSDLLQRIRARESVKILTDMTKDPKLAKRKEMLEKLPELVRILRVYFITARKVAISLEEGIEKILDSCPTMLNPDDVKAHLQLMADIFPQWLSIIPIRKGFFLKINKNEDINVLLANMPKA